MAAWIDKPGAVVGATVYRDGKLVARDSTVTLPSVSFITAEIKAMGTMELPLPQIEAMELAITRPGIDADTAALGKPGSADLEIRWVQSGVKADGTVREVGCKAFCRGTSKAVPSASIEVGSGPEAEHTFAVNRYRLVVDGKEKLLVDQLADQLVIDGVDFARNLKSML